MNESYKVEVQTEPNSDAWDTNAIRLATREEAEAYERDLASRWTLVFAHRVTESIDHPNYRFVDGKIVLI